MIDPTDEHMEITFRDGPRWVPSYVGRQLDPDEAYLITYAEAMDLINKQQFADYANGAQQKFIDSHFRGLGR
jgi:hypothetical protein